MRLVEKVIRRRVVYRGRYLTAERWDVRLPDGRRARRDIVRPPDAVAVVPVDARGRVHLVRQFRPYFPLDAQPGAVGLDAAKRFYLAAGGNVYRAARP